MSDKTKTREGDQPLPVAGQVCVQDQVIMDMLDRKRLGEQRYGSSLQTFNGRFAVRDAYEEAVDLTVYLKQVLLEAQSGRRAACVEIAAHLRRHAPAASALGLHGVDEEGVQILARLVETFGELEGAAEPDDFFVAGNTYEHPAEGTFLVKYVGRAPLGYEYPSETLGVAFGWRCDARAGAAGALPGASGAYTCADFALWERI